MLPFDAPRAAVAETDPQCQGLTSAMLEAGPTVPWAAPTTHQLDRGLLALSPRRLGAQYPSVKPGLLLAPAPPLGQEQRGLASPCIPPKPFARRRRVQQLVLGDTWDVSPPCCQPTRGPAWSQLPLLSEHHPPCWSSVPQGPWKAKLGPTLSLL